MPKKQPNVVEMTEPEAPKPQWPEATEKRLLRCDLKDADIKDLGKANASLGAEIDALEDRKKASSSAYKAQIEEREARRRGNENAIRSGFVERDVPCHWIFEASGLESDGSPIFHPDKKTLVRDDTDEVVEIKGISEDERQMALPLDAEDEE